LLSSADDLLCDATAGLELADGSVLPADLVVDASGRKSGVADWLAAAGCEAPPTKVVSSGVGYGSRVYKLKSGMQVRHLVIPVHLYVVCQAQNMCGKATQRTRPSQIISDTGWREALRTLDSEH